MALPSHGRCILDCSYGRYMHTRCACRGQIKNNNIVKDVCLLHRHDEYRLLPEHDPDTMRIISNNLRRDDPFPLGLKVAWESNRPNNNGLAFHTKRRFDHNDPTLAIMEDITVTIPADLSNSAGELSSAGAPALSFGYWSSVRVRARSRFQKCYFGIYGIPDKNGIVIPKCLKDFVGKVKGYKNFTTLKRTENPYIRYVEDMTDADIKHYVSQFLDGQAEKNIIEVLQHIRIGEYVDLYALLLGNGLDKKKAYKFCKNISTYSRVSLYNKLPPTKSLFEMWKVIENMYNVRYEEQRVMKANLVNFILNSDLVKIPPNKTKYEQNREYWWAVLIIRRAIREKLVNVSALPANLIEQNRYMKDTTIKYDETIYPKVESLKDVLDVHTHEHNTFDHFLDIIRVNRRWTREELIVLWEKFKVTYKRNKAKSFWNMVDALATDSASYARLAMSCFDRESFDVTYNENSLIFPVKDPHARNIIDLNYEEDI